MSDARLKRLEVGNIIKLLSVISFKGNFFSATFLDNIDIISSQKLFRSSEQDLSILVYSSDT